MRIRDSKATPYTHDNTHTYTHTVPCLPSHSTQQHIMHRPHQRHLGVPDSGVHQPRCPELISPRHPLTCTHVQKRRHTKTPMDTHGWKPPCAASPASAHVLAPPRGTFWDCSHHHPRLKRRLHLLHGARPGIKKARERVESWELDAWIVRLREACPGCQEELGGRAHRIWQQPTARCRCPVQSGPHAIAHLSASCLQQGQARASFPSGKSLALSTGLRS